MNSNDNITNINTKNEDSSNFKDFTLIKEYKITITKKENNINIICKNYNIQLNKNDLSNITNITFNTVEEVYNFIINLFEEKKVKIKEINNEALILEFTHNKIFEISLKYNKSIILQCKNDDCPFSNFKILNDFNISSYTYNYLGNTFCAFEAIDNIVYLIYTTLENSILSYNLINKQKINEIKKAHDIYISNLKHYLCKKEKMDLIMSISSGDNNLKLWNLTNFECLVNLKNVNDEGILASASILNDNNNYYIITSNCNWNEITGPMKVFDSSGNKIKEIIDSKEEILFLDIYYDEEKDKNYIVTGTIHCVKSYDYTENRVLHEYYEVYTSYHFGIIIYKQDNIVKIIDSATDGYIRIWDFHNKILLKKIIGTNNREWIYGISLWKNDYLLTGCNKSINLINLKDGKLVKVFEGHNKRVITIIKMKHPIYGDCFLSQGYQDDYILMWIIDK